MSHEIKSVIDLFGEVDKNRQNWDDEQFITEFYEFLQGKIPEAITIPESSQVRLTEKQAFIVIWYLQEHLRILPDHIERCDNCGDLYDTHSSGTYCEAHRKHYCGGCDYLAVDYYGDCLINDEDGEGK